MSNQTELLFSRELVILFTPIFKQFDLTIEIYTVFRILLKIYNSDTYQIANIKLKMRWILNHQN